MAKTAGPAKGGKAKKKKWSKGKVREKANNLVMFDKPTYAKLYKEVTGYKLITPAILSDRLKITGSLARVAIKKLMAEGHIRAISTHNSQSIYTRAIVPEAAPEVEVKKVEKKGKKSKKEKQLEAEEAAE